MGAEPREHRVRVGTTRRVQETVRLKTALDILDAALDYSDLPEHPGLPGTVTRSMVRARLAKRLEDDARR